MDWTLSKTPIASPTTKNRTIKVRALSTADVRSTLEIDLQTVCGSGSIENRHSTTSTQRRQKTDVHITLAIAKENTDENQNQQTPPDAKNTKSEKVAKPARDSRRNSRTEEDW
mmetsp:Transcript_22070/g.31947  ORF Transcript_22070/g.31947 Transcript_22070/m.31947 type:complete len:113 (+) Transcript_22070:307-645(+)